MKRQKKEGRMKEDIREQIEWRESKKSEERMKRKKREIKKIDRIENR